MKRKPFITIITVLLIATAVIILHRFSGCNCNGEKNDHENRDMISGVTVPTEPEKSPAVEVRPVKKAAPVLKQQNFKMIHVDPKNIWQGTGIDIVKGQHVVITSSGRWSMFSSGESNWAGPGGMAYNDSRSCTLIYENGKDGALLCRIGKGRVRVAGESTDFIAECGGELRLSINDCANYFYDNRGSVDARISVSDK